MSKAAPLLAGLLAAAAVASADVPGAPSLDALHLAQSNRAFALALYDVLGDEGNIFYSPYSISTALAMTYAGARNQTAEEMARALHFDLPPQRLHKAFAELMQRDQTVSGEKGIELAIANALWGEKSITFREDFLDLTRQYYGAGLRQVDFAHDTEAARRTINAWVADHTEDKIDELLKPADVDAGTALVLTNAVYFKGLWLEQFDAEMTDDMPFHLAGGKTIDVETMTQSAKLRMYNAENVRVLCLPYQGEKMSLVVILPNEVDGLAKLMQSLSPSAVEGWITQAQRQQVTVFLPKFKLESRIDLNAGLGKLGMNAAFSGAADFSGMAKDQKLAISRVIHEACVEVSEEGTEAAAATGVVMMRTAISPTFRADHPFLFLIRNDLTGSWLFLGRLSAPEPSTGGE
ncbi:MAG TPA: serpin family protein [Phycisphaerae bacterium]|mgnify:CR=1 FL=1|nr:serpin family protein [Phycisphaerales bacterium]HRX85299.1 serpin family protein [Phycisphaerae bacterium]